MTTDLIVQEGNTAPQLYARMQTAIVRCYTVDECRNIGNQAAAIAAYYSQISDKETERKFLAVKLRAWHRIGQILLQVDDDGCESIAAHIRKIKSTLNDATIEKLNDGSFRQALKLGRVPEKFLEENIAKHFSIADMVLAHERAERAAWENTPEGREQKQLMEAADAALAEQRATEERIREEEKQAKWKREAEEHIQLNRLITAHNEAEAEVGVTLDRRDRERMHEVVFLIKNEIHEVLRRAAFDQRTTMQAILRAGLAMWFVAHGYNVDIGEMDLRPRPKRGS